MTGYILNTIPADDEDNFCKCGKHAVVVVYTNWCPTCGSEIVLCEEHASNLANELKVEVERIAKRRNRNAG